MRTVITRVAVLCLVASAAWANAPSLINYQGNLASSGGTPLTGTYNMTFTVYDGAVGGSALWAETLSTVSVTSGLFSVLLGSVHPIGASVFSASDRWLGIRVSPDPELSPRIRLASVPYSLRTATVDSATGGNIFGTTTVYRTSGGRVVLGYNVDPLAVELRKSDGLLVGSLSYFDGGGSVLTLSDSAGQARILATADAPDVPEVQIFSPYGDKVRLRAEAGNSRLQMYDSTFSDSINLNINQTGSSVGPRLRLVDNSGDGIGAWVAMGMNASHSYLQLMDSSAGGQSIEFHTDLTGDNAVKLPANSVSAAEVLDEPGIAANVASGSTQLADILAGPPTTVMTQSITIPAPGYLVVEARCNLTLTGASDSNYANLELKDIAAGPYFTAPYVATAGYTYPLNVNSLYMFPAYLNRTFFKSAGTYTFYLFGRTRGGSPATRKAYAENPAITIRYYPTSYGSVTAVASQTEAQQFQTASLVNSGTSSGPAYTVDLRDLELKAIKAQADAEQARRQLLEAQLRAQGSNTGKSGISSPARE